MQKQKGDWKPIPDFRHYEACAATGRIRSVSHTCGGKRWRGKILRPRRATVGGYWMVTLSVEGKLATAYVHRLVWTAHRGKPRKGYHIAHMNGRADDARLANLNAVSPRENVMHSIVHGSQVRGEDHPLAKLNEQKVREIFQQRLRGATVAVLAKKHSVSPSAIRLVLVRENWAAVHIEPSLIDAAAA